MVPSVDPEKPAETPEAAMSADVTEDDDVIVEYLSHEEWEEAKRLRLEELGLTYDELRDMAQRSDFSSIDALKVWVVFGD
jgi:hypothetical protein